LNQEIPVIFAGVKEWEAISAESRAIFLKHSQSLINLGTALRERDEKRRNMKQLSKPPAPSS